jgi:CheY-like chemotaxis protein
MGTFAQEPTALAESTGGNGPYPSRALHILLAEDNIVNQKLATRLLERKGHRVTVVADGKEALAALEQGGFDLVLMDVQMPEMDGLEATAHIRAREATCGGHIPIVAMTAHAMKGDRERCLAAGFDAYVPKPVRAQELFDALEAAVSGGVNLTFSPESTASVNGLVDRQAALERVGGDETLLREIVGLFLDDYPKLLADVEAAVAAGDAARLRRAAHTLKGSVGNFGAQQAHDAARELELMGKSGDLSAAGPALDKLKQVMDQVRPALLALAPAPALSS